MRKSIHPIERYSFRERAKQAWCVVQAREPSFNRRFAFRRGVIPPDAG